MYYYQDIEYTQNELIRHLYDLCQKNKSPFSQATSKTFDVLDGTGEWYTFFFKFDNRGELTCFTCKKQIDIKGTSLRDCWKYILEGSTRKVQGFSKNTEVYEYLKRNPNKPYRLERKENNGTITVKCVIYDTILDAVVVNRVPFRK